MCGKNVMSNSVWYYEDNRQKIGPVPLDSLKDKLRQGELGQDALVWTEGWEAWKKAYDVAELASLEPPPLPPEEPPPLPDEVTQSEVTSPPLPFAVSIHGERPENCLLLTNDEQLKTLLQRIGISWSWFVHQFGLLDKDYVTRKIRKKLLSEKRYGLVVEPEEEGADRLQRFFGGRRMLDFQAEEKLRSGPDVIQRLDQALTKMITKPHKINERTKPTNSTKELSNGFSTAGLSLGLVSILLAEIGVIPMAAIIFSTIGLSKVKERKGKGKTQAWIGLVLGIIYMLANFMIHGHFG